MAKDKGPFGGLTTTAAQTAEQMTKQTQGAMENYFGWLQTTTSALPWSNTNLNRILLNHATQNVAATFAFVQKLSQAKNFQDVVKIQTEFMARHQLTSRQMVAGNRTRTRFLRQRCGPMRQFLLRQQASTPSALPRVWGSLYSPSMQ